MTEPMVTPEGAADHGLGLAHRACGRIADAAVRVLDGEAAGWVPLARLGAALVAPVPGARFDVHDPDDVDLLVRILTRWWRRISRQGADLGEPDRDRLRVQAARVPVRGDDQSVAWSQLASRATLARWTRRAQLGQEPGPVTEPSIERRRSPVADPVAALAEALRPRPVGHGPLDVLPARVVDLPGGGQAIAPWPYRRDDLSP